MQNYNPLTDTSPERLLKGTNLYLIGMMGSGKTTVGKILATHLNYRFFDTDAVLEQAIGQAISTLFAESGEAAFRQLETQVLAQLATYTRLAIATGGGIVLQRQNWSYLHHGVIIWLDVPVNQLVERLQGTTDRPLLQDTDLRQTLQHLLEQRQSLYALADIQIRVNPGETAEQVVVRILEDVSAVIQTKLMAQLMTDH